MIDRWAYISTTPKCIKRVFHLDDNFFLFYFFFTEMPSKRRTGDTGDELPSASNKLTGNGFFSDSVKS